MGGYRQACRYVPAVLALVEVDEAHAPNLQHVAEGSRLAAERQKSLRIVDKPVCNLAVDTKELFVRVAQLNEALRIYIRAVYRPFTTHLRFLLTLAEHIGTTYM